MYLFTNHFINLLFNGNILVTIKMKENGYKYSVFHCKLGIPNENKNFYGRRIYDINTISQWPVN